MAFAISGRGGHEGGGDGLRGQRPGESKLADIGISLPGTGEVPVAPVYVDGQKDVTLKGDNIAAEFTALVDRYVESRYGEGGAKRREGGSRTIPIRPVGV